MDLSYGHAVVAQNALTFVVPFQLPGSTASNASKNAPGGNASPSIPWQHSGKTRPGCLVQVQAVRIDVKLLSEQI
jgi:hypothetical protein